MGREYIGKNIEDRDIEKIEKAENKRWVWPTNSEIKVIIYVF